jgi:hypothetical protein
VNRMRMRPVLRSLRSICSSSGCGRPELVPHP